MVEICERCGINGDEVRLFNGIYNGRISNLCERCSIIENIPIIKKPDASQLKKAEVGTGVYDRMKIMSGIKKEKGDETYFQEDKLEELEKHPELELPEKDSLNLIDYFHWEVMKNRRRRGMSQKQLAENLGESEAVIQMIEKAKLPENAEILIRKLEQIFQIKLRKISERERLVTQEKIKKPVLLDEKGKELEIIPEDEESVFKENEEKRVEGNRIRDVKCRVEEFDYGKKKMICEREEKGGIKKFKEDDLNLKKVDPRGVSIGELREMHKRKIEATRQEQIEEQRKIEERRRILQALRERDRLKIEEKRRKEQIEIQRARKERNKRDEEYKHEIEERQKKDSDDIDKYLGGSELLGKSKLENSKERYSDTIEEFDRELV